MPEMLPFSQSDADEIDELMLAYHNSAEMADDGYFALGLIGISELNLRRNIAMAKQVSHLRQACNNIAV